MIINSTLINKGFSTSSELVGVSGSPPEGEGPAALSLREFKSLPLHIQFTATKQGSKIRNGNLQEGKISISLPITSTLLCGKRSYTKRQITPLA